MKCVIFISTLMRKIPPFQKKVKIFVPPAKTELMVEISSWLRRLPAADERF